MRNTPAVLLRFGALAALLVPSGLFGQIAFTDVSTDVGLVETYRSNHNHGLGGAWIDFNNDGWPDIFAVNGFDETAHLYENVDTCTTTARCFQLVDELLPVLPNVEKMGAIFADYDNDGDEDLYIFTDNEELDLVDPNFSPSDGPANILLRNLWVEKGGVIEPGETLFVDVTAAAGIEDMAEVPFGPYPAYRSTSGSWVDYDRDGFVDLYVAHWDPHRGGQDTNRDRLYHNNGDGTFTDVTASSGVNDGSDPMIDRPALAFLAAHLDLDLWPDLYAVNVHDATPFHEDLLYLNNQDGTFTESTGLSPGFGDDTGAGMGIDVADIDHDGNWDIYISDLPFNNVDASNGNALNLGNGDGTFSDNVAPAHGVFADASWGVNFFDADQDGWEDLFVAGTGSAQQNFFFQNDQDGTFTDITAGSGTMGSTPNSRGATVADYDGDGDLDLLVMETGGPIRLYQNDTVGAGHWLQVKLEGTFGNRSAIGAIIKVKPENGGDILKRQILGGTSTHSQDSLVAHFGVGATTVIRRVTVQWPSGGITDLFDVPADQVLDLTEEDATLAAFEDVTAAAGLTCEHGYVGGIINIPRRIAGGVAVADYDNDEWPDIYFESGDIGPNVLFRNNQDGTFSPAAAGGGIELETHIGAGPAFGDIDGDGWLDLFVGAADGDTPRVFRNLGDGNFEDITATTTITSTRNTYSFAFADYNKDGLMDLVSTHWDTGDSPPCPAPACTGHLWKNEGGLVFSDDDQAAGITGYETDDRTFAPNFTDIDGDGWLDLLMVGDFGTSQVFLNDGDGTYTNITDGGVITDQNGMGTAVGDYDNDGDFDWFVSSIFDPGAGKTGNRLYRNIGGGNFEDVTDAAGVREGHWGWGGCFSDFNNDGNLDLFHVNGFSGPMWEEDPSRLFMANGDGTFGESSAVVGIVDTNEGRGVSCFDYDRDGDLDIFVANNSAPCTLFRNNLTGANNYLNVKLRGRTKNVFGVGSVIRLTSGGETQTRQLRAGSNFVSQQPLEAHFGLGNKAIVTEVVVEWPDGIVNTYEKIGANQFLELKQFYHSVGVFNGTNAFRQWNKNATGPLDQRFRISGFGVNPEKGIAGDWDGDGIDTVGAYAEATGLFKLASANVGGGGTINQFVFGPVASGRLPIAGDWNGDGIDTIGTYDPVTKTFELRNTNDAGPADITFTVNVLGANLVPLAGDWNGDGIDSVGLYNVDGARFFLKNSNAAGPPEFNFKFGGQSGLSPVTGDWNGDGFETVGVWDGNQFRLRNTNSQGPADISFVQILPGGSQQPLAGQWN